MDFPGTSGQQANHRAIVLMATSFSSFLTPFLGSSVNIALPAIGEAFSMDALTLNWVSTSYLFASAVFLLPLGRIADIHGRKRVFALGIATLTLSSFLLVLCPSAGWVILFRFLQGLGSSMIFGTGVAILVSAYPPKKRGRALGINVAAVYLGLSLGPFLGGILTGHLGWESIFLATGAFGLVVFVLTVLWVRESKGEGGKLDLAGSLMYSMSLMALLYGFARVQGAQGAALALAGILGMLGFAAREKRAAQPLIGVDLIIRNRQFAMSNLAAFIHYSATFAVTFLMSLYLQYVQGMTPQQAGLVLVSQPLVMALFSPLAGRLSDRVDPRVLASVGMGVTSLGLFLLTFLSETAGLARILSALLIIGLGFAFFSSPNTNAVMGAVDRARYGLAGGFLSTMRVTGQAVSMGIALMLFTLFIGPSPITPEVYPAFMTSMRTGFGLFSLLCVLGIFASLARGGTGERAG
jgi:EmrB/QacA subfamily drug resistance transporter